MFTDDFRIELERGKYTSWANRLAPEQLRGLFWALGEYGCRADADGQELQRLLDCAARTDLHRRAIVGLRVALQFASGVYRTVEQVQAAIRGEREDGAAENGSI